MDDDLHQASNVSTWLAELARAPAPAADDRALQAGDVLGDDRYVIVSELGRGGMGVVYEAEDRKLGRLVALKTHRCKSSTGRQQLMQEAQAMAKLAHPNVVAVHDVGTWEAGVFLVADLVRGGSLEAWQRAEHTWKDIVGVYIDAGRGIAFAHAAGLVHRDFKPANVLIGPDGRCQVTDFGIALLADSGPHTDETDATLEGLFSTSAPVGTPAYMAPEQLLGLPADARSDQFSFCVALYEALFGQRPYPKTSLQLAVEKKPPKPTNRRVPRALMAALLRGLASHPSDRFETMHALLDRLQRTRSGGRRGLWAAGSVLAGLGIASAIATREGEDPCASAPTPLPTWSTEARSALAEVFAQDDDAARRWPATQRSVDAFEREWVDTWRTVCMSREDTTQEITHRSRRCLDEVRRDANATLSSLRRASGEHARTGLERVTAWTSPKECQHTAFVLAAPSPPLFALQPQVAQLRQRMREIDNDAESGVDPDELEPRLEALRGPIARLEHLPLQAELAFTEANVLFARDRTTMEPALVAAYQLARRAGHARFAALASSSLAQLLADELGRSEVGLAWAQIAVVEARHDGVPAVLAVKAELVLAIAWDMAGRWELAAAQYERALEAADRLDGEVRERQRAAILISVSGFEGARGNTERALQTGREAVETLERLDGHPTGHSLNALSNVGLALVDAGQFQDAKALFERELRERTALVGAEHPNHIGSRINLGMVADRLRDHDEARTQYEAADRLIVRFFGDEHPDRALVAMNLAFILDAEGSPQQALELRQRAVQILTAARGERGEDTLLARIELANSQRTLGDPQRPCADLDAIAALAEETLGETRVLARAHAGRGACALTRGDTAQAQQLFQAAIALSETVSDAASLRHDLRLQLASISWESGRRDEAQQRARTVLSQTDATDPLHIRAQAWLTAHPD